MTLLTFPLRRVFVALPLEGDARDHFQALQNRLKEYENIFYFQNAETAHLTLYFWNELMEIEYDDVLRRMKKIAARTPPFHLQVLTAETSVDQKTKLDRVLWLTIDRCEELSKLKKLCPWPNLQPFLPHITIARMRKPHDFCIHKKKIMKSMKDVAFDILADRVRLYAEIEGIQQTPLLDFPFGA